MRNCMFCMVHDVHQITCACKFSTQRPYETILPYCERLVEFELTELAAELSTGRDTGETVSEILGGERDFGRSDIWKA